MTSATGTDRATAAPPASPPDHARRWLVLAVVATAQLVVVLDATIVNIALPTAQADLGFGNDDRQWIVTAYALAFGSLLLLGGRLADLFGRKPLFLIGLVGFAAASAVGGAAEGFGLLVTARAAQGVFGALLAPAALSLLTVTFTDGRERGRAFAIFGAISGGGGAIGLILGGALTEYLSWRWCLYVNVPIAAVAVLGAVMFLPRADAREKGGPRLDVPGTVLSVAGLVSLVYGLGTAETDGWTATSTLGFIAAGLVLLVGFVVVETRTAHPLLPMRVVLDRTRGGAYIAVAVIGAGMFGVFLFLTYYMTTVLGFAPLPTGVAFLPMIVGLTVSAQLAPVLVNRIGLKIPVVAGFLLGAGGLLLFVTLGVDSGYWTHVFPGLVVVGLGLGLAIAPAFAAATLGVDRTDAGVASAAVNTFQQIGGSIATAVLSALAAAAATDALAGVDPGDPAALLEASVSSYTTVFAWSAAIFAAGAVISAVLLPHGAVEQDPDAAPVIAH
ncbi:Major facilitator superfamily, general substrate transporter [Modestobacter italicus]|uniref:Major facilitator superfamily, general substrate transporter n=1 Tax=Modestobacter italicus (strain DSM 44449 / CECT 9708 / BC 501) TaxID=2732864 RepID=I4ERJ8_MODI5|nr:DHA2 family efflux MFS transporter permease subunit [Modestobacter marinus]CCH86011.1 Major facilitator superfamily, general substrate transporter [Modestobacter marinus]